MNLNEAIDVLLKTLPRLERERDAHKSSWETLLEAVKLKETVIERLKAEVSDLEKAKAWPESAQAMAAKLEARDAELERLKAEVKDLRLTAGAWHRLALSNPEPDWLPVTSLPLPDDAVEYRVVESDGVLSDTAITDPKMMLYCDLLAYVEAGELQYRTTVTRYWWVEGRNKVFRDFKKAEQQARGQEP